MRLIATFVLLVTLGACGAQSLDEAVTSLQASYDSGDDAAVQAQAPDLLARAKTEGADAWRIEKLLLQAQARDGQGEAVVAGLARLAQESPAKVDAQLYSQLIKTATDGGELGAAVAIGTAGLKAFPEQRPYFDPLMQKLADEMASGNDPAAEQLRQLGYIGGNTDAPDEEDEDQP